MNNEFQMGVRTAGLIKLLKDNLVGRYKDCFCILQELLQNADDAQSTRVHFGVTKALGTEITLGAAEGFFIVNNGPVSRSNMQAIYDVAAGDKGDSEDKIGKFGLGMKSVFHVCETFVMFGEGHEELKDFPYLCTPWLPPYHQDWHDSFKRAKTALAEVMRKRIPAKMLDRSWFCVWLPLRSAETLGGVNPIIGTYPKLAVDDFTGIEYSSQLIRFLPLLKHVTDVSFGDLKGKITHFRLAPIGDGRLLGREKCNPSHPMRGEVTCADDGSKGYSYIGTERILNDEELNKLRKSHYWPKYSRWDEKFGLLTAEGSKGEIKSYDEKVNQHVAVCVLTEPSDKPTLSVVPCVFLPLSVVREKDHVKEYVREIEGGCSVTIYLHGNFFISAARGNVTLEGNDGSVEPQDESQLCASWNAKLWSRGVLPMIIDEISKAMAGWSEATKASVINAFASLSFINTSNWINTICQSKGIVHELTADGYEWRVVRSNHEMISLDEKEKDGKERLQNLICNSGLVRKVLCDSLSPNTHVVDPKAGRLVIRNSVCRSLSVEIRVNVLRSVARMSPDERNADLLLFARECANGLEFAKLDVELQQASIWKIGENGEHLCSYDELCQLIAEYRVYSEATAGLKQKLLDCVEWTVESVPLALCEALKIDVKKLDVSFVISMMQFKPVLRSVEGRRSLLTELQRSSQGEPCKKRKAIRYLIHGSKELFENTATLYSSDASLPPDFSQIVLKALSAALYGHSYSVPAEMLASLSDTDKDEYGFGRLTGDTVAVVLAETPGISYAAFPTDAWKTLLKVSDLLFSSNKVKSALRQIPLFPYEGGGRGALIDNCFYEKNVKIPTEFRSLGNFIAEPDDKDLAHRLGELVDPWKYADTYRFCRECDLSASSLSRVLTDALMHAPPNSFSSSDKQYLQETEWVPLSGGRYCCPDSILNISGFTLPDELIELHSIEEIDADTRAVLKKHELLFEADACVQKLFAELAKVPRYHLGLVSLLEGHSLDCASILSVFRNKAVLPLAGLLDQLAVVKQYCDRNLPRLTQAIDPSLVLGIAAELTDHLRECRDGNMRTLLWMYLNSYLEEVGSYDQEMFREFLDKYKFLNANMKLCSANELCTGGEGILTDHILHQEYRSAERFYSRLADNTASADAGAAWHYSFDNSSYEKYFKSWPEEFNARIGGFIVATTDAREELSLLRRKYWDANRNVSVNRKKICGDYEELIKGQTAYIAAKEGRNIQIRSLSGKFFEVEINDPREADDLFVAAGTAPFDLMPNSSSRRILRYQGEPRRLAMRLRYLSAEQIEKLPPGKLDSLLKNTFEKIASALAGTYACNADMFWSGLVSDDQLSILVTRSMLLNNAPYYLRMIGCDCGELNAKFSELKQLDQAVFEISQTGNGNCDKYLRDKNTVARSLGIEIEQNSDLQSRILEALRHKMRDMEYAEDSIIYELFQNADDASEQLYVVNHADVNAVGRFVVKITDGNLVVAHWGRPINSRRGTGGGVGAHGEFERDLENMLMLMQSSKRTGGIDVTGKFGLGFKTVFFVCDEPVVLSAGLKFKICGGFLPISLTDEERDKYRPIVNDFMRDGHGRAPTVFVLPIVPSMMQRVVESVRRFADDVKTVAMLAKRIKSIQISTPDCGMIDFESPVLENQIKMDSNRMMIGLGDATLFFGNENDLPAPLPDDVATYWATVPTALRLHLGFAINGNIDLTTGRAKLNDRSPRNRHLVHVWATRLYDALKVIFDRLAERGDDGYAFFSSLWDLLTARKRMVKWENPETWLLRDLLWDERFGGYRRFLTDRVAMPSGLDGKFRRLCSPQLLSHLVTSDVAKYELLSLIEEGTLTPGQVVAEEVFVAPAKRFFKDVRGLTKYGMLEFLTDLQRERPVLDWKWCSSEAGSHLLQALKECELDQESQLQLRNFLFMTNGSATNKAENLVGTDGYDEKRKSFVPTDYQLSSQYDETGIALFNLIRGERRIQTEELARLAARVSSFDEQGAVLRYILETHHVDFTEAFKNCNATWMKEKNVISHPYFVGLDENSQMILAGMLGFGLNSISEIEVNVSSPSPIDVDIRTLDWCAVARWWSTNSEECLRRYNDLIYDRQVDILPEDVSTFEKRSEWLELFVMAVAFSLGMRDCQHKGFIRMLRTTCLRGRTFWDIYVDENSTPQDWMDTLECFVQQDDFRRQYKYWMGLFMRIYQFSSHLSGYVQFVRMLNQLDVVQSLKSVFAIVNNPNLNGAGIVLPGLDRALCDRGQAFLMRELVRRKAVTNQKLHPYCFVRNPTFFGDRDSKSIYNFASYKLPGGDPTFGGAFDIALASYLKEERKADVLYVF